MRRDFAKVVTERPQVAAWYKFHDIRTRINGMGEDELESLPKKQGYRYPYKESKASSDLIGPLRRFLYSRIGRKWDDVYSEIREIINPDSTVQLHVLSHLYGYIDTNTFIGDDGKVWAKSKYIKGGGSIYRVSEGHLYVDPETGIICRVLVTQPKHIPGYIEAVNNLKKIFGDAWRKMIPDGNYNRWEERVIEESAKHVKIGPEKELHKIKGIWYRAIFDDVPPPFTQCWLDYKGNEQHRTILHSRRDYWTGVEHHEGRIRIGKLQASSRELRRYGIKK